MHDTHATSGRNDIEKDSIASIEIEWNFDMDKMSTEFSINGGPNIYHWKIKGRCKACWGSLIARTNKETREVTGIRCRVCGKLLEGSDAAVEDSRMSKEGNTNLLNLASGLSPRYGEGPFVQKLFPQLNHYTEQDLKKHIESKAAEGNKRGKLTRNHFPVGSPGLFLLQAQMLMDGLADISNPQDPSVATFDDFEFLDDGSVRVYPDLEGIKEDPRYFENSMSKRMGANMTMSMISAFACELAMKAISLTCSDEAKRIHDLLDLFEDLPEESRNRIRADFGEIESILEKRRRTFDSWRYFETNTGEMVLSVLIDKVAARALGKAARVIMDECEIVGLNGSATMNARQSVRQVGQQRTTRHHIDVKVSGSENPAATAI